MEIKDEVAHTRDLMWYVEDLETVPFHIVYSAVRKYRDG